MSKLFRVASIACTALIVLGGQIAKAGPGGDVKWYVTGTFADGGTLSGYFTVNVSGYPTAGNSLFTTTYGPYGQTFADGNLNENQSDPTQAPATLYFGKDAYAEDLTLTFADVLTAGTTHNDLVVGPTASYECHSFSICGRLLTSGYASIDPIAGVPEPATWGLMIAGFGLIGAAMRRAKARKIGFAA